MNTLQKATVCKKLLTSFLSPGLFQSLMTCFLSGSLLGVDVSEPFHLWDNELALLLRVILYSANLSSRAHSLLLCSLPAPCTTISSLICWTPSKLNWLHLRCPYVGMAWPNSVIWRSMSSCVWPPDMTPGPGICLGMSYSCLTPSVSLIYCPSKLIYLLLPGLLIPRLVLVSTELFSCNTIKISITSLQRALSIFPLVLNDKKSEILIFLILTFLKKV